MTDPTRRTIAELLVRYKLHPEFCDIYVEGDSDRDYFRWFLETNGRKKVGIYPIRSVEIPAEQVLRAGLEDNARSRVIVLSIALEEQLSSLHVTCIVDADFDRILHRATCESPLLLYTDYTSIEMYAYSASVVHKAVRLFGCQMEGDGSTILRTIEPILKQLFLLRLANQVSTLGLHWISFSKCSETRGDKIIFDSKEYKRRYLNTRRCGREQAAEFDACMRKYEGECDPDARQCIRGHDFTDLLAWYISQQQKRAPHPDSDTVKRVLLAALSSEDLSRETLFQNVLGRTEVCRS